MLNLTFLGGADEVGASCLLVEMDDKRLLIDAGIRISPKTRRGIEGDQLPDLQPISASGGVDYLLVTHAHTDHTGALPLLLEQYPDVPVFATRPTVMLTNILQRDAQRIMKTRQEEEGELPIVDEVAAMRLLNAFQIVEFEQTVRLGDTLQMTYHAAGHIIGAASIVLEGADGVLVISGDLSLTPQRAVGRAKLPRVKADALVLESTYGGRLHANRDAEEKRLVQTLKAITEGGGRALIPAFALGRAQEVVQILLAYRDELTVPVYVDGMVRAVCQGYRAFADLLPPLTVKAAGDADLFFRRGIVPVESTAHRNELMANSAPAIIIASSGMLTGGASAAWAKELIGGERNAILLTGYQDEESPGRALQALIAGETARIKIDGKNYDVACAVDTYSLSAHADEAELVSVADALGAEHVFLVHGDSIARSSLAHALRQRQKRVTLPKVGQTVRLTFPPRSWARKAKRDALTGGSAADPAQLWEYLKDEAGSFFSARELARIWFNDEKRAAEVVRTLSEGIYFAPDWRKHDTFRVKTPQQVAKTLRCREVMRHHPDLLGQCVVLKDSEDTLRVGVVIGTHEEGFEAIVAHTQGRNYPADALIWALGRWEGAPDEKTFKAQLMDMLTQAKTLRSALLPLAVRQNLPDAPIDPATLLPDPLPEGVSRQLALLAVTLALAQGGASWSPQGIMLHGTAADEALEQNAARAVAMAHFPPEARLRKVGMDVAQKIILLTFDFPDHASAKYAPLIAELSEKTGWRVALKGGVNQQALMEVLLELAGSDASVSRPPSYFMAEKRMSIGLAGVTDEEAFVRAFADQTGFTLELDKSSAKPPAAPKPAAKPPKPGQRMEINAAYAHIRAALEPLGMYKVGLKDGAIVATFVSPQVGQRHLARFAQLEEETGYPLRLHPHPNQQQILQMAAAHIKRAGWELRKGLSIYIERAEIGAALESQPTPEAFAQVSAAIEADTGYRLVLA